jgi:hypothetical protein
MELIRAALQNFNFSSATLSSVTKLSEKMCNFAQGVELRIAIGRFQSNEYFIYVEDPTKTSSKPRQLFNHLTFTNAKGFHGSLESTRVALTFGRLVASHHRKVRHSRWIVFLDEVKALWVMYKEQSKEESKFREALGDLYDKTWDTAFGANFSQMAVLLGPLAQLPMTEEKDIHQKPQIFQLNWMIAAASVQDHVDHDGNSFALGAQVEQTVETLATVHHTPLLASQQDNDEDSEYKLEGTPVPSVPSVPRTVVSVLQVVLLFQTGR